MESPSPGYRHRVLVLAYYFPPMGGSGVQRTAKFVKYLPMYGWEPVVLTAEPGGYYAFDETLQAEMERAGIEVRRTSSFDPNRLLGKERTVPMPGEVGRKLFSGLSQMFFVPDNKKGWAEPAFEAGKKLLEMRRFDAIFSTAPPYTSHLVGMRLSKAFGLPLITDFRDDWVGNPRHRYPTPWHRKRHEALEREVLQYSAAAVTINRAIQGNLARRTLGASGLKKVHVIPQGYDLDDFTQATPAPARSEVMRLLYAGLFYDAQKPNTFLKGLADLLERRPDIRPRIEAKFVGMLPKKGQQLIAKLKLEDVTVVDTYRPHLETVGELLSADVLWMTVGHQKAEETISTGKLYEYIGTHKPILGLVPEGTAAQTLRQYGAGVVVDPDDVVGTSVALERLFDQWATSALPHVDQAFVQTFNRQHLASDLAEVMRSTLSRLDDVVM